MQSKFYKQLFILFTACFLFSCSQDHKNDLTILATLDRSLVTTTLNIESANHTIYNALASRASERQTMGKAKIWQPKALTVKDLSDELVNYIEDIKKELREQAGLRFENRKDTFNYNDQSSVRMVFNKRGSALFDKLRNYKIDVLNIDTTFKEKFEKTLPVDIRYINNSSAFKENYFTNTPAISALTVLSSFEARIRNTESILIQFCLYNCTFTGGCGYGKGPYYLVSQSSSVVKKGEKITITAGIGTFFSNVDPVFHIAGKKIDAGLNGSAVYEFKASSIPGKHSLPVTIEYYKEDGTKEMQTKEVTYEVSKDD